MATTETKHATSGDTVENFSLKDADGKRTTLDDLSGEAGIVIGFLHGTYCPHCMQQLTRSNRLADKLADEDVSLGWVLRDEASSIAAYQLAATPQPRFAVLPDTDPSVATHLGVPAEVQELAPAPYVFYIDDQRTVRHVMDKSDNPHAPLNMDGLLAAIRAASDGASDETPQDAPQQPTPADET